MTSNRAPRRLLPWLALLAFLTAGPTCRANKKTFIPSFDAPVQNYAVIDLSKDATSSPVTVIGLNDENQVSFGYGTGIPPSPNVPYNKFCWRTWEGGAVSDESNIDACSLHGYNNPETGSGPIYDVVGIRWITGRGWGYGSKYRQFDEAYSTYNVPYWGGQWWMYSTNGGNFGPPDPPYDQIPENDISAVSQYGAVAGRCGSLMVYNAGHRDTMSSAGSPGFVLCAGNFTVFNEDGNYANINLPTNVKIVPGRLDPILVNDKGWAVSSSLTNKFWNGVELKPTGLDTRTEHPTGLNNQGQMTISAYNFGSSMKEGSLWESPTSRLILREALPVWNQWQTWNVQPFALSNQVKEATTTPGPVSADPTVNILASTEGVNVPVGGKTLWTRGSNGRWRFANIALPSGVTIAEDNWEKATINSNGIIAAIGKMGEGTKHALLLIPVNTELYMSPLPATWVEDSPFFRLTSPRVYLYATMPKLAGLDVEMKIQQDIDATVTLSYNNSNENNGGQTTWRTKVGEVFGFMPDDPEGGLPSSATVDLGNGKLKCSFDDAPYTTIFTQARHRLYGLREECSCRDFVTVRIGTGPVQVVAELKWSILMGVTCPGVIPAIGDPIPGPVLSEPNPKPGKISGAILGKNDDMITPRIPVANERLRFRGYWVPSGSNGSYSFQNPAGDY